MVDTTQHISLDLMDDPLKDMYSKLGEKFEERLLNFSSKRVKSFVEIPDYSHIAPDGLKIRLPEGESLVQDYSTSNTYSILVGMSIRKLEEHQEIDTTLTKPYMALNLI